MNLRNFKLNKKAKKYLVLSLVVISLLVLLGIVTILQSKIRCNEIRITIKDSTQSYFINKNDVLDLIYKNFGEVVGYSFDSVNIALIEENLVKNPYIKEAEVFKTIHGELIIEISQRNPILRIINLKGQSYYIDYDGIIMPASDKYTSFEILASGNIGKSFNFGDDSFLPIVNEDFKNQTLKDLFTLAKFINDNTFLLAQISQIYVNEKDEYELVPRLGNHVVEFGDISDYEEKFRNLETFYKRGINKLGWEKYSKISLKYKNQIVCTLN